MLGITTTKMPCTGKDIPPDHEAAEGEEGGRERNVLKEQRQMANLASMPPESLPPPPPTIPEGRKDSAEHAFTTADNISVRKFSHISLASLPLTPNWFSDLFGRFPSSLVETLNAGVCRITAVIVDHFSSYVQCCFMNVGSVHEFVCASKGCGPCTE